MDANEYRGNLIAYIKLIYEEFIKIFTGESTPKCAMSHITEAYCESEESIITWCVSFKSDSHKWTLDDYERHQDDLNQIIASNYCNAFKSAVIKTVSNDLSTVQIVFHVCYPDFYQYVAFMQDAVFKQCGLINLTYFKSNYIKTKFIEFFEFNKYLKRLYTLDYVDNQLVNASFCLKVSDVELSKLIDNFDLFISLYRSKGTKGAYRLLATGSKVIAGIKFVGAAGFVIKPIGTLIDKSTTEDIQLDTNNVDLLNVNEDLKTNFFNANDFLNGVKA